ncbi:MAG: hypothetical protein H0W73_20310 [Bacteroidetes bacterium]|nr:hypothetical protein [Bacteroidota bacterium]
MNPEQKFDKIIRKKVDEAEFPFDEQNWNKLSEQLDSERRLAASRGWGKFLFLGLLFLGITSAGIALYKTQGPLGIKDELANNSSSDNNGSSKQAQGVNGKNNLNTNSDNNLLASNNSSEQGAANYLAKNSNNTTSSADGLNNSTAALKNANVNSGNTNKASDVNANSENNSSVNSNISSNSLNAKSGKHATAKSSGSNLNKEGKGDKKYGAFKNVESDDQFLGERQVSGLAGAKMLEHNVLDRIDATLTINNTPRNLKLAALKIPVWYDEDYRRKGKNRISFLNAEAGGAFLLGWDSKDGKDARGFNWYAGVNYGKFLNKKVGFSVGSQFYNVGNIKQSFYESSKAVYGLGSTSSNTIITTQALYYFSVPLKFYYAVSPSHQIGAGVNPSFLFSSKNVVENYRLTDGIKSSEMVSKTSGIYEGVRLNNILLSAFYKAKLNKRMYLNAEVLYGVRDVFKNTSSNNYSQKPIGLRVGVQYTLFEK